MAFVRATHTDGDVETFRVVDETVGRENRNTIALPSASVAARAGTIGVDTDGVCRFRNALTEKSQRLDAALQLGPFVLQHVEEGPAQEEHPGPWACRFRPRVQSRHGSLCLLSTQSGLAQGHALAIDLDDAEGTLYEAYTWRTQDKRMDAGIQRSVAAVIANRARWPTQSAHLIHPSRVHHSDNLHALLFPFMPSVPLHQVVLSAAQREPPRARENARRQRDPSPQRPSIPSAIALGIQAQIGRLLTERDEAASGAFPLDWTRARICADGWVRLIPAGPWAWREPNSPSNLGALLAATAAMIGANIEDSTTPLGAVGSLLTKGGLAFLQERTPTQEVAQVRGWLAGIASDSLSRQRSFAEQAQLIDAVVVDGVSAT